MSRLVKRTVSVLAAISSKPMSLHELHEATGVHRSTLLRILTTLVEEGLIQRFEGDQKYRCTYQLRSWGERFSLSDHIAEVASDLLKEYAKTVKWPTDILVKHATLPCLVVVQTNSPLSPFPVRLNQIGSTVPLLPSAAGRAYLAFLDTEECDALLAKLFRGGRDAYHQSARLDQLPLELAVIREKGFGTRTQAFRGGDYGAARKAQDGRLAMAVPVLHKNSVIAVVNTKWSSKAHDEHEFAKRYIQKQLELAQRLSGRLP